MKGDKRQKVLETVQVFKGGGVRVIRIVQKNGQVVDTPVDPANPITIAPLEE